MGNRPLLESVIITFMSSGVSLDELKHLVKLANLNLAEEQLGKLAPSFSAFLDYVSKIKSLDTQNFEETSQVTGLENVERDDITTPSLTQEQALKNAPKTEKGFFVVESILKQD